MFYYKRHIGDYVKKTAHLSPLEHGIYNLILDSYYDREQAPTLLEATRWARARTEEEKQAVLNVLGEFFEYDEDDGYYRQQRVEDELASYHKKAVTNRAVGKLGGRPKKRQETQIKTQEETQTVSKIEVSEPTNNPNQEPLTNNTSLSEQSTNGQKKRKWGTEEDHKAAEWIFALVRKLNPDAREPNWDNWANDIRLMRENDKRDHRQICDLFRRANADSFWKSNVLSPGKLRDKWDQLSVKLNGCHIEPVKVPRREIVL